MKDFYKRLNLPPTASPQAIRQQLSTLDPATRADAEAVLLDPRRRSVYDRNRALLATIGQLRFELGVNYTRFWSRRAFKDFWMIPDIAPPPAASPGRRVDSMMIARAFHAAKHHTRRHAARWGGWIVGGVCAAAALLALAMWRLKG